MKKTISTAISALILLGAQVPAHAALAEELWGARVFTQTNNFTNTSTVGGAMAASASNEALDPLARGSATLLDNSQVMEIRVFADSPDNQDNSASGSAIQKFSYSGPNRMLNLNATFHGFLGGVQAGFTGAAVIFKESNLLFSDEAELSTAFDDGFFEGYIFEGFEPSDNGSVSDFSSQGEFEETISLSMDLTEGDVFWIYGRFAVFADGQGGQANANGEDTTYMNIDDMSGITILGGTAAVPLPPAAFLLFSAVSLLLMRDRRFKTASGK